MAGTHGVTETEGTEISQLVAGETHEQKPVTIASGEGELVRGTVLGQINDALGTPAADSGNTGDGLIGSVALGGDAQAGDYIITCIAEATNSGTFKVIAPDGARLDDATVAVAYTSGHLNFTIADGATDFAAADFFTVPVEAGSLEFKQIDLSGVDGIQKAAAILLEDVDATSAAQTAGAFFIGRYRYSDLVWPTMTAANKKLVLAALQTKGIIVDVDMSAVGATT